MKPADEICRDSEIYRHRVSTAQLNPKPLYDRSSCSSSTSASNNDNATTNLETWVGTTDAVPRHETTMTTATATATATAMTTTTSTTDTTNNTTGTSTGTGTGTGTAASTTTNTKSTTIITGWGGGRVRCWARRCAMRGEMR